MSLFSTRVDQRPGALKTTADIASFQNIIKFNMHGSKSSLVAILAYAPMASAFAPNAKAPLSSTLRATIDPDTITKKDYEDICGVNFDEQSLDERLQRTSYLYPKHVEVVEDFSPLVDRMVDEIVSTTLHFIVLRCVH